MKNTTKKIINTVKLYNDAKCIIQNARNNAIRSVDYERIKMYWMLGQRIVTEEQNGDKRASYGSKLIKELSEKLIPEFGSGLSERNLYRSIVFYKTYKILPPPGAKLNWRQYRTLLEIKDNDKREFYQEETVNNSWTGRELERQVYGNLYERLLLSNDKKKVLKAASRHQLQKSSFEIIKDPMYLEFLGLSDKTPYHESK